MSASGETPNSEPPMVAAEILDVIENILRDSPILPMSSAHIGSQFLQRTNYTIRDASGGKGVLSLLKQYDDFEVQGKLINLKGLSPRGRPPVDSDNKPAPNRGVGGRRGGRGRRGGGGGGGSIGGGRGRRRGGGNRRGFNNRRNRGSTAPLVNENSVPAEKNARPARTRNNLRKKQRRSNRDNILKAFLVDFDDGCQNFTKGVSRIPIGHSVHVYFPQRLPGSTVPDPPEEAKGFHPHVTETTAPGAVHTAIAVRAAQLAMQNRSKVHIYLVSGHVGKYAELIPQVKRLGVKFVTEVDGTKFALKDMIAVNLNEETLLVASELGQHMKLMGKDQISLRELASFAMSVVGKHDADEEEEDNEEGKDEQQQQQQQQQNDNQKQQEGGQLSMDTELTSELVDRVSMDIKQLARRSIVQVVATSSDDDEEQPQKHINLEDVTAVREHLSSSGMADGVKLRVNEDKIQSAVKAAEEKKQKREEKEKEQQVNGDQE